METELKVGCRVTSSEVNKRCSGSVYQDKQLEIVEFLPNGKVKCKYFLESESNPNVEYYDVSLNSLTFISNVALRCKRIASDPFWNRYKNKN